jgi:sugar lactone lactonase YvrE
MPLKRNGSERPSIKSLIPAAAIPGGDIQIRGSGFPVDPRPSVSIGDAPAPIVVSSNTMIVARVPEGARGGPVVVANDSATSEPKTVSIGVQIADNIHPVTNPAVDDDGNVYTTFSGSRGQKTPVAVYKVDKQGTLTPFLTDMMNATGLAFDPAGILHVSSRFDGVVYQVTSSGVMSVYVEGMGVATGIVFDKAGNLYVGDRSGTIFKISPSRQIYVFATMEPSISAYHMAFGPDGALYVSGPTTSSFDCVHRVLPNGEVEVFFRGLGRPQGLAFDIEGNLYVAASYGGRKGIVRLTPKAEPSLFLSGPNIVGLAFAPRRQMIVTTTGAAYRVFAGVEGLPLP